MSGLYIIPSRSQSLSRWFLNIFMLVDLQRNLEGWSTSLLLSIGRNVFAILSCSSPLLDWSNALWWEILYTSIISPRYLLYCSVGRLVAFSLFYGLSEHFCNCFVVLLWTFSINVICSFEWGFQIGAPYSRCSLTIATKSCLNISLSRWVNDLHTILASALAF